MASDAPPRGRAVVWWLVALLAVAHWDFWLWDERGLVLGFLPASLAYHAAYSLAVTLLWAAAVRCAWPGELEAWAQGDEGSGPSGKSAP